MTVRQAPTICRPESQILTDDEVSAAGDEWYTLQGIRVERPTTAGIYIHNGKKVLVK